MRIPTRKISKICAQAKQDEPIGFWYSRHFWASSREVMTSSRLKIAFSRRKQPSSNQPKTEKQRKNAPKTKNSKNEVIKRIVNMLLSLGRIPYLYNK